jgi:tripartite-type tricarboxylate transporter receptor subunit TctC
VLNWQITGLLAPEYPIDIRRNDLKARTVMELIALAKQTPGALNFASSGVGSPLHLAGEYFKMQAGIDIVHIPYRSSVPALVDLISGRVQMMFDNLSTGLPYVGSGKLRALAITSPERSALAPDLPTVNEAGLRGFDTYGWWGILAPAQTPPKVVETLSIAFMAAIRVKEVVANLTEQGYDPIGAPPAAFAAHIEREIAKWRPVIKATGLVAGN